MSRLAAADVPALAALYRRTLRNFALIAVPTVVGVMLCAPLAVSLLGGARFGPAVAPLRILIWSTGCLYPAILAGNLLLALGRPQLNLRAWLIATPVNIVLNFVLIPRYGAPGAAASTAVSFLIVLVAAVTMAEGTLRQTLARMH